MIQRYKIDETNFSSPLGVRGLLWKMILQIHFSLPESWLV